MSRLQELRGRMQEYVGIVEAIGAPDRCGTCAFRAGTDANKFALVTVEIERCLAEGKTFLCHHGIGDDEVPTRPCAGFTALLVQVAQDAHA